MIQAVYQIEEDTGHIKHQLQHHPHDVFQILHKHAKMHHDGGKTKGDDRHDQKGGDHIPYMDGDRHAVDQHHHRHDDELDHRFEHIHKQPRQYQNVLG